MRTLTEIAKTSPKRLAQENGIDVGLLRPVRKSDCDRSRVCWGLGNPMVHHVPSICRPLFAFVLAHTYSSAVEEGPQASLLTKLRHDACPFALSFTIKGGWGRTRPSTVSIPEATRIPVALMKSDD
jgi:hypothetical protein